MGEHSVSPLQVEVVYSSAGAIPRFAIVTGFGLGMLAGAPDVCPSWVRRLCMFLSFELLL